MTDPGIPPTPETPQVPQEAPAAPSQAGTAPTGKTVLIVEDEKPLSHALEMKLKNEGFVAKTVMNGEDALVLLKAGGYDLVLLDLIMPKLDGFSVLQELKDRGTKVPVIVLSNLGQEEDRTKAKELGAVNYFVKSNTPIAEIVTCVKTLLA